MAQTHVLSALIDKRSEVMGLIEYKQKEINLLRQQINVLDESIKIFDEEFDIKSIIPKKHIKKNKFFAHGESTKLILDFLRTNHNGYESRTIVDHIMQTKFFQNEERAKIKSSISGTLVYLKRCGKIVQEGVWYKIAY